MALVKEATLKLRLEGFAAAERHAAAIAKAFGAAQQAADRLAASAGRIRGPGAVAGPGGGLARVAAAPIARGGGGAGSIMAGAGQAAGAAGAAGIGGGSAALGAIGAAAAVATAAIYGTVAATQRLFSVVARGEQVSVVSASFERLAGAIGGGIAVMASLERATGGGVAKLDLMTAANRLLLTDLGMSRDRLEKVAQATVMLGKAQGVGATDAINRMSLALAKQEPELLDELGIKVDLTKAIHEYAQAHKVSVESIDAQTRARIFAEKVEEQALERSGKLAGTVSVQASATERITKRWNDFSAALSKLVADQPGFSKFLEAMGEAAIRVATALTPLVQVLGRVAEMMAVVVEWAGKLGAAIAASPAALGAFGAGGAALALGQSVAQQAGFTGLNGKGGAGGSGAGGGVELSSRTIAAIGQAVAAALGRPQFVGANGFTG